MTDDERLLRLEARLFSHEMLLRAIMTIWAQEHRDPEGFVEQAIESLIGSVDSLRPPVTGRQGLAHDLAAEELRRFGEQVQIRLRNIREANRDAQSGSLIG